MALVKVKLEAVRYIAAKAKYEDDNVCKKIMQIVTYKRKGIGFHNLLESPYYKNDNSPYALNIVSNTLSKSIGENWYKLVVNDEGIKFILNVLRNEVSSEELKHCIDVSMSDKDILIFLRNKEILFVNKFN